MVRNLPAHVRTRQPAQVIHYPDPVAQRGVLILHTAAEVQAFREHQAQITQRQRDRLTAIADRDRKTRRFWLGFGAVIGLAFLTLLIVAGFLLWHVLAGLGLGVLAVPGVVLLLGGVAVGGHRCITIVEHMH